MRDLAAERVPVVRARQPAARVGAIGPGDAIERRGRQAGVRALIFGPECRGAGDREIAAVQRRLRGAVLARKRRDMVRQLDDRGCGDLTVVCDVAAIDGWQGAEEGWGG